MRSNKRERESVGGGDDDETRQAVRRQCYGPAAQPARAASSRVQSTTQEKKQDRDQARPGSPGRT